MIVFDNKIKRIADILCYGVHHYQCLTCQDKSSLKKTVESTFCLPTPRENRNDILTFAAFYTTS